MVANSFRDGGDSAPPGGSPWPWLLGSLLLHALWLGPASAPPSSITTTPAKVALQWRLLPASPESALDAPATGGLGTPKPAAASPPQAAPPLLRLPPSATWAYALRWRGDEGQAWLHWQQDGERYQLLLERRTVERELPRWQSSGRIDARSGLRPQRFSTAGRRGERELPLPDDAIQDRLSWMLQAAVLAARQGLRPGGRLQLDVVGWRGERQRWLLLAERDPDTPGLLRLRRLPPEGGALEQLLWLDPAQHYRPVRLRLRYDEAERWELIAS